MKLFLLFFILLFTANSWASSKFGCPKVLVKMTNEDKDTPWIRGTRMVHFHGFKTMPTIGRLGDENSVRHRCMESGVFQPQPGFEGEFGPEELEEYLANSDAKIDGVSDKFLQNCFKEKEIGFKDTEDQRAVLSDYYALNNRLKEGGATLVEALQSVENTIAPAKGGEWNNNVKKLTNNSFIPGVEALSKEVTKCKVSPEQREQNLKNLKVSTKQAVESIAVINEQINAIRCKNVNVRGKNDYQCDEKKLSDVNRQKLELMRTMKGSIMGSSPILANDKLSRFVVETDNVKKSHFKKNANGGLDIADQADFDKTIEDHLRDSRDQMASELRKFSIAAKCLNDDNSDCSSSELAANIKTLPPASDFFVKDVIKAQEQLNLKNTHCATGNCTPELTADMKNVDMDKLDVGIFKQRLRDANAANSAMNSASCRDEIRTNHNDSDKVIFDSAVNLGLSLPTGGFALIARGALKGSGYLMKGIGSANRVVESAALVKLGQAGAKVSNFAPKITASYAPLYFGHNAANLYWGGVGMHEAWDMCHESYSSSVIEQANQARKTKQSVCDQNVKAAIPNQQLQSCLMAVGMGALNLIPFAPMAIRAIANKMKPKLVDDLIPNGNGAGVIKLSKGETPGNIKVDEPNAPKTAKADEPELKKSNKDEPNVNAKGPAINGSAESPGKSCARALAAGKTRVPSPIGFPGSIGKWVNGIGVVTQSLAGAIGMGAGAYGAYESLKGKSEEAAEPAITLTQADIPHLSALDADLAKWSDEKTGLKNAPQEFKDAVAVARKTIAQKIGEIRAAK